MCDLGPNNGRGGTGPNNGNGGTGPNNANGGTPPSPYIGGIPFLDNAAAFTATDRTAAQVAALNPIGRLHPDQIRAIEAGVNGYVSVIGSAVYNRVIARSMLTYAGIRSVEFSLTESPPGNLGFRSFSAFLGIVRNTDAGTYHLCAGPTNSPQLSAVEWTGGTDLREFTAVRSVALPSPIYEPIAHVMFGRVMYGSYYRKNPTPPPAFTGPLTINFRRMQLT